MLVLNNCQIHHNEALIDLVTEAGVLLYPIFFYLSFVIGCLLLYLPAFLPDLNPIEESFSTCKFLHAII